MSGVLAALLLAGCVATPIEQVATKPVVAADVARKTILARRATMWKDPDSIRDARIGLPHACKHSKLEVTGRYSVQQTNVPGTCVCVELNAKNSYGGYEGMRRTIAVFLEDGAFDSKDGGIKGFEEYCQQLQPFPEMNGRASQR